MSGHQIFFARSARRELERLPREIGKRVIDRIEKLALDPRPRGCKKLQGSSDLWRIRIGEYRVVYEMRESEQHIDIIVVRHRSDAYR